MKTWFFARLALGGIGKNRALYIPYLCMSMLMAALHYILGYLCQPAVILAMDGGAMTQLVMEMGRWVIGIFAAVFLYYCSTFLTGRRMKEFGLYSVLGMGKGSIARIMLWETLLTLGMALGGGLLLGLSLARVAELLLIRLLQAEIVTSIAVSGEGALVTAAVFGGIYLVILFVNLLRMRLTNPITLLRAENAGERPPRANWLVALLGLGLLGLGYYLASAVQSPADALFFFFAAVLLVIAGTFLLFISGSVTLCRLLQRNKRYYYRTNHFISLSSMAFRMKRNGAGLAAICILCTMVLVTLSSTLCLYVGIDDTLRVSYPRDYVVSVTAEREANFTPERQRELADRLLAAVREEEGVTAENICILSGLQCCGELKKAALTREGEWNGNMYFGETIILVYPLSAYEELTGEDVTLTSGELLCYALQRSLRGDSLSFYGGESYALRRVESLPDELLTAAYRSTYDCVILLAEDFDGLCAELTAASDTAQTCMSLYFDTPGAELMADSQLGTVFTEIHRFMGDAAYGCSARPRTSEQELYGFFGGLFFIGLLLGGVFSLTAALIIYYKQISEGYEDAARFTLMRKVGLDDRQIRRSINSQVLTVFFAPLLMAGLHGLFALPMVLLMLRSFGLNNAALFYQVSGGCFIVFALIYTAVYYATSRACCRLAK